MQKPTLLLCTVLGFSVAPVHNVAADDWKDLLNAVKNSNPQLNNASQTLQQGQQLINAAQALQSGNLTELLMQRTGVSKTQAETGAGALFQLAKNKMQADAFKQLEQSVPGLQGMIGTVPTLSQSGGLAGRLSALAGTQGGTVGELISVVSTFQQLGMSPQMMQQFIPVVLDYVKAHGSQTLVDSLSAALIGHL